MNFYFYLPSNGDVKNIHLSLIDLTINKKYTFKTSLSITPDQWDNEKQRPSNIYLKKYKKINKKLDKIKLQITEHIQFKRDLNKIPLQKELSKKIKDVCINKEKQLPENALLRFMENYISFRKDMICHSTYKRYMVFFRLLERFEGYTTKRLFVDTINSHFITEFIKFGREEKYSDNTLYRTIHFVKTILNFAERKGIRTNIREIEIRREKQQKTMTTLNEKEISTIKKTKIPNNLKAAKDWLLISCYTGQRFSDFIGFNQEKLITINEKTCVKFIQQKTKKEIILPLHPIVMKILKRNNNCFPKPMDIQQYNKDIRQIAKIAGLNCHIRGKKRIDHRVKELLLEKWQLLSSHIGRRSFASNFYGKIPTPLLMEATGHSTEQMFLKYINPANNERIMSLSSYFENK
ncbi:MAG: phage integrase SAM-like domain-containing protein [Empedobacter falsenii]